MVVWLLLLLLPLTNKTSVTSSQAAWLRIGSRWRSGQHARLLPLLPHPPDTAALTTRGTPRQGVHPRLPLKPGDTAGYPVHNGISWAGRTWGSPTTSPDPSATSAATITTSWLIHQEGGARQFGPPPEADQKAYSEATGTWSTD